MQEFLKTVKSAVKIHGFLYVKDSIFIFLFLK